MSTTLRRAVRSEASRLRRSYDRDPQMAAAFVSGLIGDGCHLGTLDPHDMLEGYIAAHNLTGDLLREALKNHLDTLRHS